MKIAEREIGPNTRPYVIAEMSGNHNQSLERALEIVDAAARSGADALKLQTYTADTMTLDVDTPGFTIDDPKSLWNGRRLYELYQEASTPWDWHKPIMQRAAEHNMHCFSSPFDATAVEFLETLDVPAYKIASFECTDLPLIAKVAATGKPMIISTGMASLGEISEAVDAARNNGCTDILLLKCTSSYPAIPTDTNISTIPHLRQAFGCEVGLSDHTMGTGVAAASIALGATMLEKHFTLRRADGGVDSAFSLEPEEFKQLVVETERAWQAMGNVRYGPMPAEEKSLAFRRSIYISKDLQAGDILTKDNLRIVRPGYGLPPKYFVKLIGMRICKPVTKGTPMSWDLIN